MQDLSEGMVQKEDEFTNMTKSEINNDWVIMEEDLSERDDNVGLVAGSDWLPQEIEDVVKQQFEVSSK